MHGPRGAITLYRHPQPQALPGQNRRHLWFVVCPRIEQQDAGRGEVLGVPGHDVQTVAARGGGDETVACGNELTGLLRGGGGLLRGASGVGWRSGRGGEEHDFHVPNAFSVLESRIVWHRAEVCFL
jgi:hypothetical protein